MEVGAAKDLQMLCALCVWAERLDNRGGGQAIVELQNAGNAVDAVHDNVIGYPLRQEEIFLFRWTWALAKKKREFE